MSNRRRLQRPRPNAAQHQGQLEASAAELTARLLELVADDRQAAATEAAMTAGRVQTATAAVSIARAFKEAFGAEKTRELAAVIRAGH